MKISVAFYLSIITLCFSCGDVGHPQIYADAKTADSIVLNFTDPGTTTIVKIASTTEKLGLDKIKDLYTGAAITPSKCQSDGAMLLYKEGKPIISGFFQFRNKDCKLIKVEVNNFPYYIKLSDEQAAFLASLEAKASEL
jgi:hypothetical protein